MNGTQLLSMNRSSFGPDPVQLPAPIAVSSTWVSLIASYNPGRGLQPILILVFYFATITSAHVRTCAWTEINVILFV
jgi:hypothetical protein